VIRAVRWVVGNLKKEYIKKVDENGEPLDDEPDY